MIKIDGKETAANIKAEIAAEVAGMVARGEKRPHLAAILVGHDGGSETYVASKVKACEECGFKSTLIRFEADIDEQTLLDAVDQLNRDEDVDGFIVQLPLPPHISEQKVIEAIDYRKDVDGFHPINVGRSNIVGKPVATLMMQKGVPGDATVTVCHRATRNLKEICRQADIIIAAMGVPGFVTADMVKEGATVIDVGTTRVPDATRKSGFRLRGDVEFDEVAPKCAYITPVPGGVGPMTIVSLMRNTLLAGQKAIYK